MEYEKACGKKKLIYKRTSFRSEGPASRPRTLYLTLWFLPLSCRKSGITQTSRSDTPARIVNTIVTLCESTHKTRSRGLSP